MISRQVHRAMKRMNAKVQAAYFKKPRVSAARKKILHGLAVLSEKANNPVYENDRFNAIRTMWELNTEFLELARGKGGKKPRNKMYIKPVAFRTDRTNPIGHFA